MIQYCVCIGFNCSVALLPRQIVSAGDSEPYAVKTVIGWGVCGNMLVEMSPENSTTNDNFTFKTSVREMLPDQVRHMFERDFNEKISNEQISLHDKQFVSKVSEVHKRNDGHLEIPLPFKNENVTLPNNRYQAVKRLCGLKKRIESDL